MAVPYTFATATSSIPLSQLDSNFATGITLGNTTVYLGNTTTSFGNLTLTNATISSVATTFPNSFLANSSVTIGSTNVSLGGTAATIAGLTLTSPTINGGSSTATQNLANVTGTLAVSNGGTGLTSLTTGYIPYGNGTSAFSSASTLSYSSTSGLTVNGITQSYNTTLYNVDGTLSNYASNNGVYLNGNAGGFLLLSGDGTRNQSIKLNGGSSSAIQFLTAGVEVGRFSPAGYLGIGTSSPSFPLTVATSSGDTRIAIQASDLELLLVLGMVKLRIKQKLEVLLAIQVPHIFLQIGFMVQVEIHILVMVMQANMFNMVVCMLGKLRHQAQQETQ